MLLGCASQEREDEEDETGVQGQHNIQSDSLEPQQSEVVERPQFESEERREEMDSNSCNNMDIRVGQTVTDHEEVKVTEQQQPDLGERIEGLLVIELV